MIETVVISNRISKFDRMLNHINRFFVPQITCVGQHISIKIALFSFLMKCFPMQVFEKIALFSLRNTVIKIALEVATHKQLVETSKQVTATRTYLMRMKWNKHPVSNSSDNLGTLEGPILIKNNMHCYCDQH